MGLGVTGSECLTAQHREGVHMQPREDTMHRPSKVGTTEVLQSKVATA
jgi:hypothetical protein